MKWKLVPADVVTGEMVAAGIETPVANTGNDDVDRPEDYKQVFLSMLEAAPNPPVLSDERILEIAMSDDVSLIEDQGPGVRPRITVHNSIGGVYALARAIERELLGENK